MKLGRHPFAPAVKNGRISQAHVIAYLALDESDKCEKKRNISRMFGGVQNKATQVQVSNGQFTRAAVLLLL